MYFFSKGWTGHQGKMEKDSNICTHIRLLLLKASSSYSIKCIKTSGSGS